MDTVVLRVDPVAVDDSAIRQAAEAIKHGGIVGFPTETVYGLAADLFNVSAVARLLDIKGRAQDNPLPVQVASVEAVYSLATGVSSAARRLMEEFWPGPLTIVVPASSCVPDVVTAGTGNVGVRIPDHEVAMKLIHASGTPIVAPSANPSGAPPAVDAQQVREYFDGLVEIILDAGPCQIRVSSTVIDTTVSPFRVLRWGSIGEDRLRRYL